MSTLKEAIQDIAAIDCDSNEFMSRETMVSMFKAFEAVKDAMVKARCWVVIGLSPRDSDDIQEFHRTHNLHVFLSEKEAEDVAKKWNDQEREEYRTHPWWGPYEENGKNFVVEQRDEVPYRYLKSATRELWERD